MCSERLVYEKPDYPVQTDTSLMLYLVLINPSTHTVLKSSACHVAAYDRRRTKSLAIIGWRHKQSSQLASFS